MTPTRKYSRHRGFTLIEALAAIAIMAIIIPVLLQGFTIAGGIAESARQYAEATNLAQSTLDELVATQDWQLGTNSGQADIGPTHYLWEAMVDNYEAEANVQTLTVTVTWQPGRGGQNQIQLVTIVYIPGSTIQTNSTLGTSPLGGKLP